MAKFRKGDVVSYVSYRNMQRKEGKGVIIDVDRVPEGTSKKETILYAVKDLDDKTVGTFTWEDLNLESRDYKKPQEKMGGLEEACEIKVVFATELEAKPGYKITLVGIARVDTFIPTSCLNGTYLDVYYSICHPLDEFNTEIGINNAQKNADSVYSFDIRDFDPCMVKPILYGVYETINKRIKEGKKVYFCGKRQKL